MKKIAHAIEDAQVALHNEVRAALDKFTIAGLPCTCHGGWEQTDE